MGLSTRVCKNVLAGATFAAPNEALGLHLQSTRLAILNARK